MKQKPNKELVKKIEEYRFQEGRGIVYVQMLKGYGFNVEQINFVNTDWSGIRKHIVNK